MGKALSLILGIFLLLPSLARASGWEGKSPDQLGLRDLRELAADFSGCVFDAGSHGAGFNFVKGRIIRTSSADGRAPLSLELVDAESHRSITFLPESFSSKGYQFQTRITLAGQSYDLNVDLVFHGLADRVANDNYPSDDEEYVMRFTNAQGADANLDVHCSAYDQPSLSEKKTSHSVR